MVAVPQRISLPLNDLLVGEVRAPLEQAAN
jgi:hypothetical protein